MPHTSCYNNNWAVIVSTSRFWYNYRHPSNSLSVYHAIKRLGIPDSQIILMMADDVACNPRNVEPGCVFNHYDRKINVYDKLVEVDYRDKDVTVESFLRVLTGRHEAHVPRSKRLLSDSQSNVLLYLTGHGGDGFLKFQDTEGLTSQDLSDALQQMWDKKRYKHFLFIIDTCQAKSLPDFIRSPNVISMPSSMIGESSYSHHNDEILGVPVIDRFTNHLLMFLEHLNPSSPTTIGDFEDTWRGIDFKSTPTLTWTSPLTRATVTKMKLVDFFGNSISVHPMSDTKSTWDRGYNHLSNETKINILMSGPEDSMPILNPTRIKGHIIRFSFAGHDQNAAGNVFVILLLGLVSYYLICKWIAYKKGQNSFIECSDDHQSEKEQQNT